MFCFLFQRESKRKYQPCLGYNMFCVSCFLRTLLVISVLLAQIDGSGQWNNTNLNQWNPSMSKQNNRSKGHLCSWFLWFQRETQKGNQPCLGSPTKRQKANCCFGLKERTRVQLMFGVL